MAAEDLFCGKVGKGISKLCYYCLMASRAHALVGVMGAEPRRLPKPTGKAATTDDVCGKPSLANSIGQVGKLPWWLPENECKTQR